MQMILNQSEIRQAVVEYLEKRGFDGLGQSDVYIVYQGADGVAAKIIIDANKLTCEGTGGPYR